MEKDRLNAIMQIFAELDHGEQVDLFLNLKDALLQNRAARREEHEKILQVQQENIKTIFAGNDMIISNNSAAVKTG
jgi:hypothetical protein